MKRQIFLIVSMMLVVSSLLGGTIFSDLLHHDYAFIVCSVMIGIVFGVCFKSHVVGKFCLALSTIILSVILMIQPLFLGMVIYVIAMLLVIWFVIISRFDESYKTTSLTTASPDVEKYGRVQKSYFIETTQTSDTVYEWDDMNVQSWFGDTIIHLGQTILPEEQINHIVIQKAVGDIHILAPIDIGIMLYHNTIKGTALFEMEEYRLQNEKLKIYSENYLEAQRKIHILTTTYIGNIEVVRI